MAASHRCRSLITENRLTAGFAQGTLESVERTHMSDARESSMTKDEYAVFEALNPFFKVILTGPRRLVDGKHYFDTVAEDVVFESRYQFPGWPTMIRGRASPMAPF